MSSPSTFWQVSARFSKYAPYRLHRLLCKLTGGNFGASYPGMKLNVLLLTTTGRKSGTQHTHPLMYYRDGENYVVSASNAGADKPPFWYLNLKACPEATVQVRDVTHRVAAHEANAAERTRLWGLLTELHPLFTAYQTFTERQIPVIILHPIKQVE